MENNTQYNLSFSEWAKKVTIEHPDILKQMRESMDPWERVVSRRIMEIAGGAENA